MPEGFFNATEGSGKKLHTWQRTIGANDVHDEYVLMGEQPLATYAANSPTVSIATANDHPMQLMASASVNLYVRRIMVYLAGLATTAVNAEFRIFRLTTAGTGGTSTASVAFDTTAGAAGGAAMTLPTAKGTEGSRMWIGDAQLTQTVSATPGKDALLFDLLFDGEHLPALRVPAGASNGIAFKNVTAVAGASIAVNVWWSEANF